MAGDYGYGQCHREGAGIALKAAAVEMGFQDDVQLHKWIRPSANVGHEPKATVAFHIAAWAEENESFIPKQRSGVK